MGSFAPQTVYSNNPSPQTGAGLAALASNLEAVKELPGAQAPQSVSIADNSLTFSVGTGGVAAVSAYLIVDTEGQAAADDLSVINPVLSATDNLHDGMLLFLQAADQSRMVTVRNSSSANGILTADGEDVALTADAWYCLQLRQGTWREVQGLREASALTAVDGLQTSVNALAGDVATRTTADGAARAAMPSGHLITVSMPFTAPSDGWIHVGWASTATGRVGLFILAPGNTQHSTAFSLTASSQVDITLPISAGQTATATGSFVGATFTYANGTAPTA